MKKQTPVKMYRLGDQAAGGAYFDIAPMGALYDRAGGQTDAPHRHDFYTVIWVRQGGGSHLVDFNQYPIHDRQVHFVGPGQVHQVHTPRRPSGWVMRFSADFMDASGVAYDFILKINLFRPYGDSPPIVLDGPGGARLERIARAMHAYGQLGLRYQQEAVGACLKLFLIECVNACELGAPSTPAGVSRLLAGFRKQVEAHYTHRHKVADYADMLHVTPKHLNAVVREAIGCTAKAYIIDRLVLEAKRLLAHGTATVKEIALALGFKAPLHFNAFFKKHTGATPLDFRKEAANAR